MRGRNKTKVFAARVISPQDKVDEIKAALKANQVEDQGIVARLLHCREQLRQNREAKSVLEESLQDYLRRNRNPHTSTAPGSSEEEDSEDSSNSSESAESDCYSADSAANLSSARSASKELVESGRGHNHDPIRKRKREPEGRLSSGLLQS
jgi:hypothetical protein